MAKEAMEFQKRQKQINEIFAQIDKDFETWKEGALIFEHCEYCTDVDLDSDDFLLGGECIWSSEDESNAEIGYRQDDREHHDDVEIEALQSIEGGCGGE